MKRVLLINMFSHYQRSLGVMPDKCLVEEYCASLTSSTEEMTSMINGAGSHTSALKQYLENQMIRVFKLRQNVLAALNCEQPSICAIVVAYALNVYHDGSQDKMDLSAYVWWPFAAVKRMRKFKLTEELRKARAACIGAAWYQSNLSITAQTNINAIVCGYPPALYALARYLVNKPEYYAALNLAQMLGDRDALVEWYVDNDMQAALERISWYSRAKYMLYTKYGKYLSGDDMIKLFNDGVREIAPAIGPALLMENKPKEASQWFKDPAWQRHARIGNACFGTIVIEHFQNKLILEITGAYLMHWLNHAVFHVTPAMNLLVIAPIEYHAELRTCLGHIPNTIYECPRG